MYPFLATTTLYWIATDTFTADPVCPSTTSTVNQVIKPFIKIPNMNCMQSRKCVVLFNFWNIFCVETMWSIEFVSELSVVSVEEAANRHTLHYYTPCYLTHVHPADQLLVTANTQRHIYLLQILLQSITRSRRQAWWGMPPLGMHMHACTYAHTHRGTDRSKT